MRTKYDIYVFIYFLLLNQVKAEELTTAQMISSWVNSPPAEVNIMSFTRQYWSVFYTELQSVY
jgi:hypothetical protein